MKIGLYFGSFNPIHHGHLIIASYIIQNTPMDQLWFVVSPQNPLKPAAGLLNEYHRLALVQLAIEGEKRMRAVDIEFRLPRPSFTIDTLTYLQEKYDQYEFSIVMGSDSFQNISKWKNYEQLLQSHAIYIYRRRNYTNITSHPNASVTVVDAPFVEISATQIREYIREAKSIRYLVPENVREEIERNGYFRQRD